MFVDFDFVVLFFGVAGLYFYGMSGKLILTQYGSAYVIFRQYVECMIHAF